MSRTIPVPNEWSGWINKRLVYTGADRYADYWSNEIVHSGFYTPEGEPIMVVLGDLGPRRIGAAPPHFVSMPGAYWRVE